MKNESKRFVLAADAVQEDQGGGITRAIMGFNDSLMLVRVNFDEGAVGYTHSHPHSQVAYVESGAFEFTIGDETCLLQAGDCAYVQPDMEHGAVCVKPGVLLDIFSPAREDFLEG